MRIAIPHNTDKESAKQKITERIGHMFSQYGHYLSESKHEWDGDRLNFSGAARGFKASGSLEVTDSEVIIEGKLPLIAKPFEPRVKHTIEREAEAMFKTA